MVKKDSEIKFRIDKLTMEAAQAKAAKLDVSLSQILRQLLREWLREDKQSLEEDESRDK